MDLTPEVWKQWPQNYQTEAAIHFPDRRHGSPALPSQISAWFGQSANGIIRFEDSF